MTDLLNRAIARIEQLPEIQQDQLAARLLREIEEQQGWNQVAAKSLSQAYSASEPDYQDSDVRK